MSKVKLGFAVATTVVAGAVTLAQTAKLAKFLKRGKKVTKNKETANKVKETAQEVVDKNVVKILDELNILDKNVIVKVEMSVEKGRNFTRDSSIQFGCQITETINDTKIYTVIINADSHFVLSKNEEDFKQKVLSTLAHELRHVYQDANGLKNKDEYITPQQNLLLYAMQEVELDAREYEMDYISKNEKISISKKFDFAKDRLFIKTSRAINNFVA